jgi:hypothetical protein
VPFFVVKVLPGWPPFWLLCGTGAGFYGYTSGVDRAPDSDLRSLTLAGASAFAGALVFQYALGVATLDGDTYINTSSSGTNWALIAAAKFLAVSLLVACAAIHRRWVVVRTNRKPSLWIRLSLIPVAALLAYRCPWVANDLVYDSYGVGSMAMALSYVGIPAMLVASSILPLNFGVTACVIGGLVSGVIFGGGGTVHTRAFDGAYAASSPLIGELFAILCLGGGREMPLRRRLVQHAGAGAGFACIASSLLWMNLERGGEVLSGLFTIVGILLIPGVPIVVERRRMLADRKG